MTHVLTSSPSARRLQLSDARLREAVANVVRRMVPSHEVDDVVQAAFTDAIASQNTPDNPEELRRWVIGIARHKAADLHRRRRREQVGDTPELEAPSGPQSASELLRWAERELPEGDGAHQTLDWMLREGAGEKLESIAESEQIPAPRVRQRVARLRKHFRERWAAQTAIGAAILLALGFALWSWRRINAPDRIVRDVPSALPSHDGDPDPLQRARELRQVALEQCEKQEWQRCLDGLDDAAKLDPEGDRAEEIKRARQAARDHLSPPIDSASPSPSSLLPTQAPPSDTVAPPSDGVVPAPDSSSVSKAPAPTSTTSAPARSLMLKESGGSSGKGPPRSKPSSKMDSMGDLPSDLMSKDGKK
ncbi:MAG: sigma-70 family RNA polymerase sigma factor [Polyangiaceae bacterium]